VCCRSVAKELDVRIAQVAPLFESVPPQLYGGTERVVSYLTEELVDLGHRVTLFASGDSVSGAQLRAGCSKALRLGGSADAAARAHRAMLAEVYERRHEFDVIHFHIRDWHQREPRLLATSHVTTVHDALDHPAQRACYEEPGLRLISITDAQRRPLQSADWLGTVYHGLPDGLYRPRREHGDYLTFLGRISPETRVDRAIEIARRFGMRLKIAAKVAPKDYPYYLSLRPQLRAPFVEFVGEVNEQQKSELLAGAYALLFPIDWPEPFGLSMIEAMASGTPVIAWRDGSVPELVDHGVTGFVIDSVDSAVGALSRIDQLDRGLVARVAWQRFAARRMARDYLRLYARSVVRDLTVPALLGGSVDALVPAALSPVVGRPTLVASAHAGQGE
jgi:glycosyltransferase involved in cell wall biosynthesis